MRTINEICGTGLYCDQRKNLDCTYDSGKMGKCNCQPGFSWNGQKCLHKNPRKYGESCDSYAECIEYGNDCIKGKCQCNIGLKREGNICRYGNYQSLTLI